MPNLTSPTGKPPAPAGQGGAISQPAAAQVAALPTPPAPQLPTPAAQAATAASSAAADRAADLLRRAVAAHSQWRSVAARIRTEVNLLDQHLIGSGTYLQGPAQQSAWRMEMRIQTDGGASSLLQASDGKQFWTFRQIAGRDYLEWIDAARVDRLLARQDAAAAGAPQTPHAPSGVGLGVGGLPRLLRSLGENFEFASANEGRLEAMPVWILTGTWRPATLAVLLPEQRAAIEEGKPANLSRLMAHVPDRVMLYLGRDDLFPYRLQYFRDHPGEKEWEASARKNPGQAIVTLEWFEVRFNVPLASDQFYYNPGDAKFDDVTGRYLQSLGLPLE